MRHPITLEIGSLVVETTDERTRLEGLPQRLEAAFGILAERLRKSPFARHGAIEDLTREKLQLSALAAEEILGPRGAERLAEDLYHQLTQGIS